jgi:putative hydrolase of the HAD superfamily
MSQAAGVMKAERIDPGLVRVVTFDGDGTLWDVRAAARLALEGVVRKLRTEVPQARSITVTDLERAREVEAAERHGQSMEEIRQASFAQVLSGCGTDVDDAYVADLATWFLEQRRERTSPYTDVRAALEALKADGYGLALLTDGNTTPDVTGLEDLLSSYVHVSALAGRWKPDPEIWRSAAVSFGVEAVQMLHVGDDPELDYRAALTAGCQAVLLCRGRSCLDRHGRCVSSLSEVVNMLALNRSSAADAE